MITSGVLSELERSVEGLPDRQAAVARYILREPHKAKLISLQALCKSCRASEPVVFALCKRLGLSGFTQLKSALAEELGAREVIEKARNGDEVETADADLHAIGHAPGILRHLTGLYVRSLKDTMQCVDASSFREAVRRIGGAGRIVILGVGISGNVGFVVMQNFLRTGIPTSWVIDPNLFFTHLAPLGKKDVCLALTQTGSQTDVLEGVSFAASRGIHVVTITSDPTSPIARASNTLLLTAKAPVETMTHLSIGAAMAAPVLLVADALAVAVGALDQRAHAARSKAVSKANKKRLIKRSNGR